MAVFTWPTSDTDAPSAIAVVQGTKLALTNTSIKCYLWSNPANLQVVHLANTKMHMLIDLIVGARPNFMKVAPILRL